MKETEPRKKFPIVTTIALIIVFAFPLVAVMVPTTTEARSYDPDTRLEEINKEIRQLLSKLNRLYAERRALLAGDNDENPGYVDPRLIEAHATVYVYDSEKRTKVEVVYDRKERTLYTTATTRSGIVRAVAKHLRVSERSVDRVLEITYIRRAPSSSWDYSQNEHDYDEDYRDTYDESEDYAYDSDDRDGRWWGDATYAYMSDEEYEREKETWWDNDGY